MVSVLIRRVALLFVLLPVSTLFSQLERLGDAPVVPPRLHVSKSAATFATVAPSAASDWYDTANREAVRSAYNTVFVPTTGIPLGYVGDPVNGIAGDTSAAYKAAALRRLNFFRAM